MLNILVNKEGLVSAVEYPTTPSKVQDTDIIIESINRQELVDAIMDSSVDVKILNINTLDFELDYTRYNQEQIEKQEKELIENLIPSRKEILMAEVELNTINLLQEIGVI